MLCTARATRHQPAVGGLSDGHPPRLIGGRNAYTLAACPLERPSNLRASDDDPPGGRPWKALHRASRAVDSARLREEVPAPRALGAERVGPIPGTGRNP